MSDTNPYRAPNLPDASSPDPAASNPVPRTTAVAEFFTTLGLLAVIFAIVAIILTALQLAS